MTGIYSFPCSFVKIQWQLFFPLLFQQMTLSFLV